MGRKTLVVFITAIILAMVLGISNVKIFAETIDENKEVLLNPRRSLNASNIQQKIIRGTVYVQLRPVLEALGWVIEWNPVTKDISCKNGKRLLIFKSDTSAAFVDGKYVMLDNPAVVLDGATYIPSNFMAQQFGTQISWDGSNNLIITMDYDRKKISVEGKENIIIAGNGIIVNIFEPYSIFTIYDMVSYADGLLAKNKAESAVIKYKEILKNLSADDDPEIYIHVLINLGNAYSLLAEKKDVKMNILLAKDMYEKVLQVCKTQEVSDDYGSYLLNFGNAYRVLYEVSGDRRYLVRATNLYNEAWDYCSSNERLPDNGLIQYNLGLAYRELGMKNSAYSSLSEAIDLFKRALSVCAAEVSPSIYAHIQYNLGNAYLLLSEEKDIYIKESKAAYEEALKVWIPESYPFDYARTHRCIGDVYRRMYWIDGNEDNLKSALTEYNEGLKFFSLKTYPVDYAQINTEIGNTYLILEQSEWEGKWLEESKTAYREALKVYNYIDYPVYHKYLVEKLDERKETTKPN